MAKYKVGYTAGTFDLLHKGHLNLLFEAKKRCECLIVGVNSDKLVEKFKGKIPVIDEEQRLLIISALKVVDKALIVGSLDKIEAHTKFKFDAAFIGDDWKGNPRWIQTEKDLAKIGVPVEYLPYTKGISSSSITEEIKKQEESEADDPVRVLQINGSSNYFGGVSSFLFEVYKNIDRSRVQFDFLSPQMTTYALNRNELEQMGANIFELEISGNVITRKLKLWAALSGFLRKNKYKIIHINSGGFFFNLTSAFAAKCAGIKAIIVHSHNSLESKITFKNLLIALSKPLLTLFATDFFACSGKAAESMFPKKFMNQGKVRIINNGIEVDKFVFNEEVRKEKRKELKLNNKFVLGHVGRFQYQKNHDFLIKVFRELHDQFQNSVLILVGEGEHKNAIMSKVVKLGLEASVVFLGVRSDVNELMQAMDVFVLPSYHEGLAIVGIEAQAACLPVFASDSIPHEMKITKLITFLSLNKPAYEWSEQILQYRAGHQRINMSKEIINAGYHIDDTAKRLEKIYLGKSN